MQRMRHFALFCTFLLTFAKLMTAQHVIATLPVGGYPNGIALNPVTGKVYVSNSGSYPAFMSVIDTTTLAVSSINLNSQPTAVVLNSTTNKIFAAQYYSGSLAVIDGSTLSVVTIPLFDSLALAVDEITNKVYSIGNSGSTMTVIDGATLSTTQVSVGSAPIAIAVDSTRNKIYVVNYASRSLTVLDGATLFSTSIAVGDGPASVAINKTTNKIYVGNTIDGTVTVVDGGTLSTSTVSVNGSANAVAVNEVTNKIYVANSLNNNVEVIDGTTLSTLTVPTPDSPQNVVVDPTHNKIYVANGQIFSSVDGSLTVIDGSNNATTSLVIGMDPGPELIDPATNHIYVANRVDGTVSVIDGTPPAASQFVAVAPCRLVDTRLTGNPVQGNSSESFAVPQLGNCNIPAGTAAYSLNVTMVPPPGGEVGFLSIYPTGEAPPNSSLMNSWDGRYKANAVIVPAGEAGAVSVFSSDATDVVLDINGYFVTPSDSTLAFYPLAPCRVADTRWANGALGGPNLSAGQQRDLPVQESQCGIPATAAAYSFNFTVVPRRGPVWVFSGWPAGQQQPETSTLNAPTGTVVANGAIVPAGRNGDIDVWASNDADLVVDVNGYFAAAGSGGLSLYTVPPCRVLDTRTVYPGSPFTGLLGYPVNVPATVCNVWSTAQAFVLNATVVPAGQPLWLLTLWPDGGQEPNASTLNAWDGAVTSNMAIVPSGNDSLDAYAAGLTQLILDISGYFAP